MVVLTYNFSSCSKSLKSLELKFWILFLDNVLEFFYNLIMSWYIISIKSTYKCLRSSRCSKVCEDTWWSPREFINLKETFMLIYNLHTYFTLMNILTVLGVVESAGKPYLTKPLGYHLSNHWNIFMENPPQVENSKYCCF